MTMNAANRKADQSLPEFYTGTGVVAQVPLNVEQLIPYTKVALVDTISSLQDSEGEVIYVPEVHEVLNKIHDILDNAMSKQVGNAAHLLVYAFYSASRKHHKVQASQFPFLHSLKDMVPISEGFLYGCINWSLAKTKQQFP